ncbi:MAG TPA: TetR/AcrR family transcriptional regulator [Phenylobacterium sp.]
MSVDTDERPQAKVRGPNAVRRNATREKLLNATIDCLYSLGYYRTSTVLVTEKAKVSRGSLLHQFPTKADLMVATAEHIGRMRLAAWREQGRGVPPSPQRLGKLIEAMWGEVNTPSGVARIEIMLASRSDPELAAKYGPLIAEGERRHRESIWRLAESLGARDRSVIDATVQLYSAALRGLAIDALFPQRRHIAGAVAILKQAVIDVVEREAARGGG